MIHTHVDGQATKQTIITIVNKCEREWNVERGGNRRYWLFTFAGDNC